MVDNDAACAVLGNHEYNALCFHTLKDGHRDSWLRPHSEKNIKQHSETLRQFENNQEEWENYLAWFMTLPLFLDLGDIRVIHASWIPSEINKIKEWTSGDLKLNETFLQKSALMGNDEFDAIEMLLKGVEIQLPEDADSFHDNEGHSRNRIRINWWNSAKGKTFEEMLFPKVESNGVARHIIPSTYADLLPVYRDDVPVFFGHYWIRKSFHNFSSSYLDFVIRLGNRGLAGELNFGMELRLLTWFAKTLRALLETIMGAFWKPLGYGPGTG